jgi:transposase
MRAPKPPHRDDTKASTLRSRGTLNLHPERVQDEAFRTHEFFDPRDRVQVRYEMLRRHRLDGRPVTEAAATFGVSRPAFYAADNAFEREGLAGLIPHRRGPKAAHKCTDEVLDFVEQLRTTETATSRAIIVDAVQDRFGVRINARSLDRALQRRKKNSPGIQNRGPGKSESFRGEPHA